MSDFARRQSTRGMAHQEAEDVQPSRLRQSAEHIKSS